MSDLEKLAVGQAARYVLENSRRGNASLNDEQFDADTDKLLAAYRDIITKAIASGFLAPSGQERLGTLEEAARKADDFAMLADATFLSWQERARQNLDGMDVAGGCAIGMAHQARCIAAAIRTPIPSSRREGGECDCGCKGDPFICIESDGSDCS